MKSTEDFIDTAPLPIIATGEAKSDPSREKSSDSGMIAASMAFMAFSGLLLGTTIANLNDRLVHEALEAERPPSNERNLDVSELASSILNSPVLVDCNTEKIEITHAESEDDTHTLAYVTKHSNGMLEYVPPYITMRGRLCDDLLTFPRMEKPDDNELASTYEIRAKEFAKAAAVLLHEKEHVEHVFDEGEATCYAVQKLPEAIEEYYSTYDEALTYAVAATSELSFELKPEYTSPDCKPGGAFDLNISPVYTTDSTLFRNQ